MKADLKISRSVLSEYSRLVHAMKEAGDPPCIHCSTRRVTRCARTGYQCADFIAFVGDISEGLQFRLIEEDMLDNPSSRRN
jgi:hypothetical protein